VSTNKSSKDSATDFLNPVSSVANSDQLTQPSPSAGALVVGHPFVAVRTSLPAGNLVAVGLPSLEASVSGRLVENSSLASGIERHEAKVVEQARNRGRRITATSNV
jgi:hypothetical protein